MGNSLSPFLANLETSLEDHIDFPKTWIRYVDDVFAIVRKDNVQATLDLLNSQYSSIKFTHEVEKDNCLPFLDLKVIRTSNNKLEFDIFRKPTSTPRFITGDSFHSFSNKYAAFNSMAHRLVNIPLSRERFNAERTLILQLAKFNNLSINEVNNIISKHCKKRKMKGTYLQPLVQPEIRKYVKLTYFPGITTKIAKALNKNNLNAVWTSNTKLKTYLGSVKQKVDDLQKSGIYRISCNGCNATYIGMTSRSLEKRFKDHVRDIKNNTEKTALAKHIKTENETYGRGRRRQKKHEINQESIKLLKQISGYTRLSVWESIFIRKNRSTAVNDNGLIDSSLIRTLGSTIS